MEEIKNKLKSYFRDDFYIKEVVDYINDITDIFEYTNKNISVVVYYNKSKDKIDFKFIKRVIKRGVTVNKNKQIKITLLLTDVKKILETDKVLTPNNANSGFTFIDNNEIFIFRKEEFPKVIIHELIHHDLNIQNKTFKPENKQLLLKHFNINSNCKIILNETIIEFWATITHLSFVSKEYKIDYGLLLATELKYSLYKCYQLLKLHIKQPDKIWYDECNIYCYIIFKTILFYYSKELMKIYSFPYDDTKITNFLIQHSHLLVSILKAKKTNPSFQLSRSKVIQRPDNSLCFMLFSDL